MSRFDEPLTKALDPKTAKLLHSVLGLETVGDLLRHYPRRYAERGELTSLDALEVDEHVTVVGEVTRLMRKPMRNRGGTWLEAEVVDGGRNKIYLAFFGKGSHVAESRLKPGRRGMFAGKVGLFGSRTSPRWQLSHPEFELFEEGEASAEDFAAAPVPIYPAGKDLTPWAIRRAIGVVLDTLGPLDDPLPASLRARRGLEGLGEALVAIHRPKDFADMQRARKRLKFDEAFVLQAVLLQRRQAATAWPAKPRPRRADGLLTDFDGRLPFSLTEGQALVGEEIAADLALEHPMHRLLQGEVGAGKTVVALRAMLQVVDAGGQAALLAPTEVLATQHYRGINEQLGALGRAGEIDGDPCGTQLTLVTGSLGAAARRAALAKAADGTAGIVVGTHALLYEGVDFQDLGLVVVDEQHRFGVEQRDALRAKAARPPHVLVMTATPIPRTVAMTVYGDLETSTLSQLPRGRSPIASHVVPPERPAFLDRAWQRLREEAKAGHQAYVVCPRIGTGSADEDEEPPGDNEPARRPPLAVTEVAPLLAEGPLRGLRIGVLHGKLPSDEKDAVMRAFAGGDLDVLVATTVIEVGVDVPNATVMIIMDADRFGVSQLHQLRGRVGRGSAAGICLLVTESVEGTAARERLDAVAATTDGFRLSEIDLEQRREGDVLGASQSGRHSHLRLLSLLHDAKLITDARTEAAELIAGDPDLADHPALAASVAALVDEERAEYLEKG